MPILNLPPFEPRILAEGEKREIFDTLRRKYVALTPEEWVRQHFVHYLLEEKGYPRNLLANEVSLQLNGLSRRCDTLVYDAYLHPLMIVEYKAPTLPLQEKVFAQISRYNMALHVRYLTVSNGMQHFCCRIDYEDLSYAFLEQIPNYVEIANSGKPTA
ncbi:MAG: type I restriction enzyme HsdR N-terminal domain-containing protein [Tannerella sp.]|nr:type I restriction enzyme HsdR N-terminal domain-containing protein [Tannerella sp.]